MCDWHFDLYIGLHGLTPTVFLWLTYWQLNGFQ